MSYTAETLATFMATELGDTGTKLGLTAESAAIGEAVNEVAAVLGVSGVADVTDSLKLRTVARWQAWRTAKGAASGQYDLKSGTSSLTRSQLWDHVNNMLRDTEQAATRYSEVALAIGGACPVPMPYAGGLSRADKATRESNTDRVAPFFTRRLHEPVGVGSETD